MEVWKDIKGYENLYQVSNCGRVKSLYNYKRNGTNILKPRIKRGYYTIGLRKNGIRKWYQVHRLVASAFIPNKDNLPQVNHKNENKLDNKIENLEWCSVSYNNCYGTRIKKVIEKTSRPIYQYNLNGCFIKEYPSVSSASRELNISPSGICKCLNGVYKKAYGYIWKDKR